MTPTGSPLLAAALAFQRRLDVALASRVEDIPCGTAIFREELPRVTDLNVLLVERGAAEAGALKLMAEAERLQVGLPHRAIRIDEPGVAAQLAPEFAGSGWVVSRTAVLVLRRSPDRMIDVSCVELVDTELLRAARESAIRRVHRDLDVAGEALEVGALQADEAQLEAYAALVNGEVAAYCLLRIGDGGAKLVEVQALARAKGQGVGRATIWAAAFSARRRGISPIFVECEDEEWAKSVYHRLGFDEVGKVYRFVRPWGD
ncbi:MAG: hypothetical protein QOH38_1025 [Thermoleophilaceae bacterium]|nr:hypothetical protein [Thermoleophilaceae bacterium]